VPHTNLNFSRMGTGIALLSLVVVLLSSSLLFHHNKPNDSDRLIAGIFAVLQGATMFSSRLVAEEHHFWYWTSFAWVVYLGLGRYDYHAMFSPH
jgi:ethanolaminephosphotransferase